MTLRYCLSERTHFDKLTKKKKIADFGIQKATIKKGNLKIGGKYTFLNIWSPLYKLSLDSLLPMSKCKNLQSRQK